MYGENIRPNRLQANKNKKYHIDYAKYCIGNVNRTQKYGFVYKSLINWAFYKGNQWLFAEDLDLFLMDESGESRNRIKFIQNIIRPFVEYYTGSAIRMDISAQAFSRTTQAIDRKEKALAKVDAAYEIYRKAPEIFKPAMMEEFVMSEDKEENKAAFESLYKDEYVEKVNDILNALVKRNNIEDKKVLLIKHIVLDGIGIIKESERFGGHVTDIIDGRRFFFDTSAKLPSLKDSEYMGDWSLQSIADIVEQCPGISRTKIQMLENASSMSRSINGLHSMVSFEYGQSNGKIPVYNVEWRDLETDLFGACYDENGFAALVKIDSEDSPYTSKDLIPESELKNLAKDNFWIEKVLNFKNTKLVTLDALRYCRFVPSEFLSDDSEDFVLEYGLKPFVPRYSYNYQYPDWSYKCYCWSYDNGEILSPIDDLISPQRFINRLLSTGESQINNVRGSGPIFSRDTIDPNGGEEELQRNVNLGKAVIIDGPVNNSVGHYTNQIGSGTIQLFDLADKMKKMADSVIGGGAELQGAGGSYRASASVADQNLNQGTIMQEPVFYCVHRILLDVYESFANRGRRILCANQNQLVVDAGEEGMKIIALTRDFDIEDFRVDIKRATDPKQESQTANEMLLLLLEKQLIDSTTYAKYFGKATMNTIGTAIREYTNLKIQAEREKQKQLQEQQQKQAEAQGAAMKLAALEKDKEAADAQQLAMIKSGSGNVAQQGDGGVVENLLDKTAIPKGLQ